MLSVYDCLYPYIMRTMVIICLFSLSKLDSKGAVLLCLGFGAVTSDKQHVLTCLGRKIVGSTPQDAVRVCYAVGPGHQSHPSMLCAVFVSH